MQKTTTTTVTSGVHNNAQTTETTTNNRITKYSSTPDVAENYCAYGMKGFVCLLAIISIVVSVFAARSCEFISFIDTDGDPPDLAQEPPFSIAISGTVGIFGYEITEYYNRVGESDGCLAYDENFGQQRAYPSLATAQFCALIAPIFAGIGIFACAVDLCVCNFGGSFLMASLLFAVACGLQAATFTLLADPAFCLEDVELQCETGPGSHMSIAATVMYAICCLLMCCTPRADPFCHNMGFGTGPRVIEEKHIYRNEMTRPQNQQYNQQYPQQQQQQPQQVIVQPIIYQQPPSPEVKNKKKKGKKKNSTNMSDVV